ncbi:MAG: hypothetical protein V1836_02740 [Candidatus Aenigmatarchaeota archaeon]
MIWADAFIALGFIGFFTVWAASVGVIAIFGAFKRSLVYNLLISWIFGIFLVSLSPIGSIIIAVLVRMFLFGLSKFTRAEIEHIFVFDDRKAPKMTHHLFWLALPVVILVVAYAATLVFAPPFEVGWYKMKDTAIVELTKSPTTTVSDIEWNDIKEMRLVSREYALQIPKTMITETGWKLSPNWDGIYPINNTQYWVASYEPATLINSGNPSPAYVLINGHDPSDRKKIYENIEYSEGRSSLPDILYQIFRGKIRDLGIVLWLKYPFFDFGDPILTHDQNGPVWILPAKMSLPTIFLVDFYTDQSGIVTLDNAGDMNYYSTEQIRAGNTPSWLEKQILIDEGYSDERALKWAKYYYWKDFINFYFQHENVFEMAQDLYFQYEKSNNRNYALIQLEPEGYERKSITHFIEIESSGRNFGNVTIYDSRKLELIGPGRALDDVRGEVSIYKNWYPLQPLFKKIKDGYFYVVPVYSGEAESMVLRGAAVVDAKTEQVKLFKWADVPEAASTNNSSLSIPSDCSIISTQTVDNKLRITLECS